MRVLQLIHKAQRRGAETFAVQLSKELDKRNVVSDILTVYDSEIPELDLPHKTLRASRWPVFPDIRAVKRLCKLMSGYDLIQANSGDTLKYAATASVLAKNPIPLVFRNASTMSQYVDSSIKKSFNGWLLKQCDAVASVSGVSRSDITHLYPFLKSKTHVLPIGIDIGISIHPVKRNGRPVFVHVGGFSFEKNHHGLIRIFKSYIDDYGDAELWLVGDGPLRGEVEMQVSNLDLNSQVQFFGFVSNPLDYIASADVLLLPSVIEGLPGVILEAFYCRTPVIAYDTGGISEILKNETGLILTLNDEQGFKERMNHAINVENQVLMEKRVQSGYDLVKSEYSNDKVAQRFIGLYKNLIDAN